jgi:hypothetical protein
MPMTALRPIVTLFVPRHGSWISTSQLNFQQYHHQQSSPGSRGGGFCSPSFSLHSRTWSPLSCPPNQHSMLATALPVRRLSRMRSHGPLQWQHQHGMARPSTAQLLISCSSWIRMYNELGHNTHWPSSPCSITTNCQTALAPMPALTAWAAPASSSSNPHQMYPPKPIGTPFLCSTIFLSLNQKTPQHLAPTRLPLNYVRCFSCAATSHLQTKLPLPY